MYSIARKLDSIRERSIYSFCFTSSLAFILAILSVFQSSSSFFVFFEVEYPLYISSDCNRKILFFRSLFCSYCQWLWNYFYLFFSVLINYYFIELFVKKKYWSNWICRKNLIISFVITLTVEYNIFFHQDFQFGKLWGDVQLLQYFFFTKSSMK